MTSPPSDLPAMATNPKFIFFTDFDGTITLQDSNDYLTDTYGMGRSRRLELGAAVLDGSLTFRSAFAQMLGSVPLPFSACTAALAQQARFDAGFVPFLRYAADNNIPVVILSGGMAPIISSMLHAELGSEMAEKLQVVANGVRVRDGKKDLDEEGGWEIEFRDESGFGHDKARTIRPYAQLGEGRPVMFYAGDGVSDLSAARETDLLFAKKGKDLVTYCVREEVPFTVFGDWGEILEKVKAVVEGRTTVQEEAKEGLKTYHKGEAGVPVV
ncbi:hypothetical protein EJ06DRAFT_533950 [Trichodelitschia bisporula]|uniref:Phosphoserine phosphatase n=1 Tax=Trichodelitschia bisporula TaxID=703511 RepID=A0A6G1HKT9_9PEZI|nr:hypothetical protein EJ06DRAFT_533950 [Trichodelitschia bisporula]